MPDLKDQLVASVLEGVARQRAAEGPVSALRPGDRIEYGVTHELTVDEGQAWVRYGISSTLSEGESADEANARVVGFVNAVVMAAATEVAQQLMDG